MVKFGFFDSLCKTSNLGKQFDEIYLLSTRLNESKYRSPSKGVQVNESDYWIPQKKKDFNKMIRKIFFVKFPFQTNTVDIIKIKL